MKNLYCSLIILLFCFESCTHHSPKQQNVNNCGSGYILIAYIGEMNSVRWPTLIHTDARDSSYMKYVGRNGDDGKDKNLKYGFDLPFSFFENSPYPMCVVDLKTFRLLKSFILAHNTGVNAAKGRGATRDWNTQIVILHDQCDSVMYTVNHSNVGYFKSMQDTIKSLHNTDLEEVITYCRWTQGYD